MDLGKEARLGKREKLRYKLGLTIAMAYLTESSVTRMALQSCSKLGQDGYIFFPCTNFSLDVGHW